MNFQTYHSCPFVFTTEKDIMVKKQLDRLPYVNVYEPKPQMLISYVFNLLTFYFRTLKSVSSQ